MWESATLPLSNSADAIAGFRHDNQKSCNAHTTCKLANLASTSTVMNNLFAGRGVRIHISSGQAMKGSITSDHVMAGTRKAFHKLDANAS